MKIKVSEIIIVFIVLLLLYATAFTQDQKGDVTFRRMGVHNGNLIATIFFNQGDISGWSGWGYPPPRVEWPKGSGHEYGNENSLFVIAEVTDNLGNTLHILSESSLDWDATDINLQNGEQMGWEPIPGYFNAGQESPAMSHLPESWPDSWPDRQNQGDPGWPGSWNGFFGRDVFQADQESYFVMDDNFNTEFPNFVPDPSDPSRKGLALKVSVRGLQWADPLAQDAMFWLYDITNVGATTYDKIIFGEVFDARMGGQGDENDDWADFDTALDFVFSWDLDDLGSGGWSPVGYFGFAFLESPGISNDGIDNDEDGLIDESRDSGPGTLIFGPIGIYGEPKEHWSGDEDGDWIGFSDLNSNGQWNTGEPLNDDLGKDGIGPDNPPYPGRDTGEGDGIPTEGEPNFDRTDVDESDMIGLTSMDAHIENTVKFSNDESMWPLLLPGHFTAPSPILGAVNYEFFYGSGFFTLEPGKTQRFSLAMVLGEDKDDILNNKQIVQIIYNDNFKFGVVTDTKDEAHAGLPVEYSLSQNYPNPFNPLTNIPFSLPHSNKVSLIIYDLLGKEVSRLVDRQMSVGDHTVTWDASNVSSGIYFYRLQAGDFVQTRKMVLLK